MRIYDSNECKASLPFNLKLINTFCLVIVLLLIGSCARPKNIESAILDDRNSFYYINVDEYPKDRRSLPIGVFDSGTGGLSVLNDIINYKVYIDPKRDCTKEGYGSGAFNNESFVFLADLANMPYGSYSPENNTELLVEHVMKDMQFLLGNKYYQTAGSAQYKEDKNPVKAIVIACNTATAYALDTIREFIGKSGLNLGVIGVIDAAADGAISNFSADESGSIAVLATAGTVMSGAYIRSLENVKKKSGRRGEISVYQQAGIGIAEAIDENNDFILRSATKPREGYKGPSETGTGEIQIDMSLWDRYNFTMEGGEILFDGTKDNPLNIQINSVRNYISFHLVSLMENIVKSGESKSLKVVILACTHYPFFEDTFREELSRLREYKEEGKYIYKDYMDEEIIIVNPAVNIAAQLYLYLSERNILNPKLPGKSEFYISVPNILNKQVRLREDGSFTNEYKYGREVNDIQEYIKCVPFSRNSIPSDILERLSLQVPSVFELIVKFNNENLKTEFLNEEGKIKRKDAKAQIIN